MEKDNKEILYSIEEVIKYFREKNKTLSEENEANKIVLDFLQLLHKDYMGIEELDNNTKQSIIEMYNCIKENLDLETENKKNTEHINSYINNFERSTYIIDEKIKQKRLKPKTNH